MILRCRDCDAAREFVALLAACVGYLYVHSAKEPRLVAGVATHTLENGLDDRSGEMLRYRRRQEECVVKILVTGGAGFIGSHVVDAYLDAGYEVVVVDDLSTGFQRNLNPAAKLYRLDMRDPGLSEVFAEEQPDYVNHHAAQASVNASMKDPIHDASINILGSVNVIQCARRSGVRKLIYASTGGAAVGEPRYLPVDEEHPVQPLSPYGVTKHSVEHYLHLFRVNHSLSYTILRYSNVYGPRQDPHGEAGVVAIFTGRMLRGEQPTVNGSGEQQRDFVYVSDVARANLAALQKGDGGMYNIGSGIGTSVNEVFERLARIAGYPHPPHHGPALPGEVFKIYVDITKAARDLDWQPLVGLDEGLTRTVEFFRGGE